MCGLVLVWFLVGSAHGLEVRKAVCAGSYYPAEREKLAALVDKLLETEKGATVTGRLRALIMPHAPLGQAGPVYGAGYALVPSDTKRVVILAPWHPRYEHLPADRAAMRGIGSIPKKGAYETPLGTVPLDSVVSAVRESASCFGAVGAAHFWEEAIEVQLPFLQRRLEAFSLVPILLDAGADSAAVASALVEVVSDPGTLLVASAASSHRGGGGGPSAGEWVDRVVAGERESLESVDFCGRVPVGALLILAERLGWGAQLIHSHQCDAGGQTCRVVCIGFVERSENVNLLRASALADWRDPATQEAFDAALRASSRTNFQGDFLSAGEKVLLLDLARRSIRNTLLKTDLPAVPLYSDTLTRKLGCFVTLEKNGRLRGCIGNLVASEELVKAVRKNALRAAFQDKRFKPVSLGEMDEIVLEVSVLSEPTAVAYRDASDLLRQLEPGRHGVVIASKGKRATYLPQVWSQIPGKEAFLSNLCRKGGMPMDAWKTPEITDIFFYEVFAFRESEQD